MHVVIVGGGSAIAQEVIAHYLRNDAKVTAICRNRVPAITDRGLKIKRGIDAASGYRIRGPFYHAEPIDVMITLVGDVDNFNIQKMTLKSWHKIIDANLTAVFQALKTGLFMIRDNGNVVVVGSIVGSTGGYGCANYAAAKAGLVGLVRAAANENASRGVCINLLELGYVDAGMGARLDPKVKEKVLPTIPLRRFARAEEVVDAIDYLGRVRYMTGGILTLAGGLR